MPKIFFESPGKAPVLTTSLDDEYTITVTRPEDCACVWMTKHELVGPCACVRDREYVARLKFLRSNDSKPAGRCDWWNDYRSHSPESSRIEACAIDATQLYLTVREQPRPGRATFSSTAMQ
ncbi:hypothetical protein OKW42_004304 [Paraburkholderia sp. WC7.3d]